LIRRKAAFVYPVPPAPPTAVLVPWFKSPWFKSPWFKSHGFKSWRSRAHGAVRVFDGWGEEAAGYRPSAIAGTWSQLEPLLTVKIEALTHAVLVLARARDDLLSVEQRQRLWRSFRVPVFEQIIGENGALLAAECETHAGLHIVSQELESPKPEVAGWSIESGPCGCGRNTPRIIAPGRIEEIRAAAAYAR
jgi:hypothetical protein